MVDAQPVLNLGRFLEVSLRCDDVLDSIAFYTKLGFTQAATGDSWNYPYAVLTDGRICLGLHAEQAEDMVLTFVLPNLLRQAEALESQGHRLTLRRLGESVFNEIGFDAPCGAHLRLIEARSFSPAARSGTSESLCGYFDQIALPCERTPPAQAFWESAGFVALEEELGSWSYVALTSDFLDLGLLDAGALRSPALWFDAHNVRESMARIKTLGLDAEARLPGRLRGAAHALLLAPEGTHLLLREEGAEIRS